MVTFKKLHTSQTVRFDIGLPDLGICLRPLSSLDI